jgi:hypothetical protein
MVSGKQLNRGIGRSMAFVAGGAAGTYVVEEKAAGKIRENKSSIMCLLMEERNARFCVIYGHGNCQ